MPILADLTRDFQLQSATMEITLFLLCIGLYNNKFTAYIGGEREKKSEIK
jgi:hypothetical protein